MNELMTQGFEELNENDLEMVDGGVDWWGVVKGAGRMCWGYASGSAGLVYGAVTGNWKCLKYGIRQTNKGSAKIAKAIVFG